MSLKSFCCFILALTFIDALPTDTDVNDAKQAITDLLQRTSVDVTIEGPNGGTFKDYPFIAGFVRLAFHDCVGEGKCDGCINFNLPSNNGISRYTQELDAEYERGSTFGGMSRADFYALASIVALELSTSQTDQKFEGLSEFKFGRVDCASSPTTNAADNFPNSHHGFDQTIQYFSDEFDFTAEESVALLGAHSLGRARLENSGFEGRWTDSWTDTTNAERLTPQSTLDNQYYREIDIPWKQLRNEEGNFQWHEIPINAANTQASRSDPNQQTILLNSDFCFKWLYTGDDSNGGLASCSTNCRNGNVAPFDRAAHDTCCPLSSTAGLVNTFRTDNAAFLQSFKAVFMKMINLQFTDANPGTVITTPPPTTTEEPSSSTSPPNGPPPPPPPPRNGRGGRNGQRRNGPPPPRDSFDAATDEVETILDELMELGY